MKKKLNLTINLRYDSYGVEQEERDGIKALKWDDIQRLNRINIRNPNFDIIHFTVIDTNQPVKEFCPKENGIWYCKKYNEMLKLVI